MLLAAVKIGILNVIEFIINIFILLRRDLKCNRIHYQYLHLSFFMIPIPFFEINNFLIHLYMYSFVDN